MKKFIEKIYGLEKIHGKQINTLLTCGAKLKANHVSISFEADNAILVARRAFKQEEFKVPLAFLVAGAKVSWDHDREALIAEYNNFYVVASRTYNKEAVYWSAGYVSKKRWAEFIEAFDEKFLENELSVDKLGFFAYNWKYAKPINHDLSWFELARVAVTAKDKDINISKIIEGVEDLI